MNDVAYEEIRLFKNKINNEELSLFTDVGGVNPAIGPSNYWMKKWMIDYSGMLT